jgi:outer membrane protein assembly factor BamD
VLAKLRVRSSVICALLASTVLLSGCSLLHRHKASEDTQYAEQPVDQLYAAGALRLDHHQWVDSIAYFKEVERQHPYSEWSRRAIMMEAFAHYQSNQYQEAVNDANRFIQLYPGNASAAYAYYLKAECYFEQILDVGRDQAATEQALAAMREVARRYPKSEYAQDARLKIDMINDQLAGKEMSVGRWYLRQGETLAAIGRFKLVVDRYQTTSDTPEAMYRLVEAYLTLGLIGEAKRNAAVLGYNFPGDVWYADAYRLMTSKGFQPEVAPKPSNGLFHRAARALSLKSMHGSALPPPTSGPILPANVAESPVVETEGGVPAGSVPAEPATTAPGRHRGIFGWSHHEKAAPAPANAADQSDETQPPKKKGLFGWMHHGSKAAPAAPPSPDAAPAAPVSEPAAPVAAAPEVVTDQPTAGDAAPKKKGMFGWMHHGAAKPKPAPVEAPAATPPAPATTDQPPAKKKKGGLHWPFGKKPKPDADASQPAN